MTQTPALLRHPDADHRLFELFAARQHDPFLWGLRDCWTLAADAVLAVRGQDPFADVRGTYASAVQAARVLRRHGQLHGLMQARLGAPIAAADAQPGDVVLIHQATGGPSQRVALAVVWGCVLLAQGAHGLVTVRPELARMHWRSACLS